MSEAVPLTVVSRNESVAPPGKPVVAEPVAPPVAVPRQEDRERRRLPGFAAAVAVIAALVALAAPGLRSFTVGAADRWLGTGNPVSALLAPADAGWQAAMQPLHAQLVGQAARLERLAAAQQAMAADLAQAMVGLRTEHAAGAALTRAVDGLARQTQELRATATAIDARVRAAGLLTLSLRLRRDLDAGLPLDHDLAAIVAAGPYPVAVNQALKQLHAASDGVPTMRDLADEFDRVIARVAARGAADASWMRGAWDGVAALFGSVPMPSDTSRQIARLRARAADGRFSEVASELAATPDADLGADWVARVRLRASAVLATQALLAYSLVAYENAFAAKGAR